MYVLTEGWDAAARMCTSSPLGPINGKPHYPYRNDGIRAHCCGNKVMVGGRLRPRQHTGRNHDDTNSVATVAGGGGSSWSQSSTSSGSSDVKVYRGTRIVMIIFSCYCRYVHTSSSSSSSSSSSTSSSIPSPRGSLGHHR